MVNTAERKQELVAALHSIPNLSLRLETLDEATTKVAPVREIEQHVIAVTARPAFAGAIVKIIPDSEDRSHFIEQTLTSVDLAMSHAWALRRLEERYPNGQIDQLDQSGKQSLELLLKDHITVLNHQIEVAEQSLARLGATADLPSQRMARPGPEDSWQRSVVSIFESTEQMQSGIRGILIATDSPDKQDLATAVAETQHRIDVLRDRVASLSGTVGSSF
ncbi:MAG: hypothetical protein PW789_03820 [Edaphobacter sp.]|uniref:hypothetical protein n=1 Tax=Edaphobacter sp. TaxID=1934404 RepID=UPI00238DEFF1|nr:hypothetical protein [Edaphobacter sp.]MDE1175713.1 hypothetical protein [Edaphobacter sp.]